MKIKTMHRKGKTYDVIPANWGVAVSISMIYGIFLAFSIRNWEDTFERYVTFPFMTFLVIFCLLKYLRSFLVAEDEICCCWIGIPVRTIPWTQVRQVGIASAGRARLVIGDIILLTLEDCPEFRPGVDQGSSYTTRHPLRAIGMDYSKRAQMILEKYYGPFDFTK